MIGPSGPNGSPNPIVNDAESGFIRPVRGGILLLRRRTDSIASDMPSPEAWCEPYFIIRPAMRLPKAGRATTNRPRLLNWGEAKEKLNRW